MEKILIVEDNIEIHNLIKNIIEREKYIVYNAYSGTEALMILEKERIDLILLDLILPGKSGEEIINIIKDIPIIVISAKISVQDKIKALLNGANDYITKPFDSDELVTRVKVQLRSKENKKNNELIYKDMILKQDSRFLYIKDQKVHLTKTEFAILKQLILDPKQIVSKTRLLELISNDTLDGDENSLKVHISNIRKKIKSISEKEYIESVWGIGFKMCE